MLRKKSYDVLLRSKEKVRMLTGMDGAFDHRFRYHAVEVTARTDREALSLARSEAARFGMYLARVAKLKVIYSNEHYMAKRGESARALRRWDHL